MEKSIRFPSPGGAAGRLLLCGSLVALLILGLSASALAGPPEPQYKGPEQCAACHQPEMEAWQNSAHAQAMTALEQAHELSCAEGDEQCSDCLRCHTTDFDAAAGTFAYGGVTCEACHGPYVEGHPQAGVMQLTVDSSVCQDCHADTFQQWETSSHGEAGVQCIGCHLSHSQEFRLTDEALCGSCHGDRLDDFAHTAHSTAGVGCVDCHASSAPPAEVAGETVVRAVAPSHSFIVSSEACVGCHGESIHEEAWRAPEDPARNVRLLAMAESAPELAARLKTVEKTNKSLETMTFVSLGLGIGIGGMMGIVFMLVVGYIIQGRAKK